MKINKKSSLIISDNSTVYFFNLIQMLISEKKTTQTINNFKNQTH
jgi:hypothetical protein